ncbi:udp-2,3-diacylglucosamine hydrolase [hydrocarbon metagenome]|uniref:Udp-2,3-diacylglucosamine hydrolase n=1 Tax=hydrocarbon metagenome TaxID=938273 RepID=A0A0W8FMU0_9ZZZZ
MKAIFISDAHLRKFSDERYKKLLNFLDDVKKGNIPAQGNHNVKGTNPGNIDGLYIAGDLFDFWFCRKEKINPEFKPMIDKLIELKEKGIRIHLCEGNHDFFMGEYFSDVLGMEVFEEMTNAKLDKLNVLIAHGDTADRDNKRYLLFRKILRSRTFYNIQSFIPSSISWSLAGLTSSASKELTVEDGDALVKKMSSFALARFQENYDAVILGHSHVPSLNNYTIEGKKKTFVTLGDWISYYSFLYYEDGNFFLRYYQP